MSKSIVRPNDHHLLWGCVGAYDAACVAAIAAVAMTIALWGIHRSGPLWNDAPRYANAATMMHYWMRDGQWLSPLEFAKRDYAQFPGFSIPYHPPGYPGLMALFFFVTGVSYGAARLFVALAAAVAGGAFFAMGRLSGAGRTLALGTSMLLVTTPEFMKWSRCTMSEVPATAAILIATLVFFLWCEHRRAWLVWAAFAMAELAFFCRVSTAGILPGWFLFLGAAYGWRRLASIHLWLPATLYLGVNAGWVRFVGTYSAFGVAADGKDHAFTLEAVADFLTYLPCLKEMLTWGTLWVAAVGTVCAAGAWVAGRGRPSRAVLLFAAWCLGFALFKSLMPTTPAIRHSFGMLPGLAGLAFGLPWHSAVWRRLTFGLLAFVVAVNLAHFPEIPKGVVGYDQVARELVAQEPEGNILMCCWDDQDLIFRYRSESKRTRVQLLRGDRLLAIRLPAYAQIPSTQLAYSCDEVLEIVRRGNVQYMVTCAPAAGEPDRRDPEMCLAHQCAECHPEHFELLAQFPLFRGYTLRGYHSTIFIWRHLGPFTPGASSQLPIIIPTAKLEL